jgi:hypothetical protein
LRNKFWFNYAVPVLNALWATIEHEKVHGYQHRSPNKKIKLDAKTTSIMGSATCWIDLNMFADNVDVNANANANEPIQSEPIQSEPIQSEPIQSEPIQSEPIQSEPIQSESTDIILNITTDVYSHDQVVII